MIEPSLKQLMERADSRYHLVIMTAKRARQLVSGEQPLIKTDPKSKAVTIAVKEIAEGKVRCAPSGSQ